MKSIDDIIKYLEELKEQEPTKFDSTWHPDGFSLFADEEGAVRVKKVDEHAARLPKSVQDKLFKVWYFRDAYEKASFPNELARRIAYQNLSWRLWVVFLFPPQPAWQAVRFEISEVQKQKDYFSPPDTNGSAWRLKEVRFDAGSMNWDPAMNAEYVYNFWKDQARGELISQGYKPEEYGL